MKLRISEHPHVERRDVTGREARATLKRVLGEIGDSILVPSPQAKRKIRRRCLDTLRAGRAIWTHIDQHGQPSKGTILTMPPRIAAIIDADGKRHEFDEDGKEKPGV